MTHKYLYIEESGEQFTADSRIWIVRCSQVGAQNVRDYMYLVTHALRHGHYFAKWSPSVATFVQNLSKSVGFDVSQHFQMVSSRALVRSFRADLALPLDSKFLRQQERARKYLDLNYRIMSNLRAKSFASGKT